MSNSESHDNYFSHFCRLVRLVVHSLWISNIRTKRATESRVKGYMLQVWNRCEPCLHKRVWSLTNSKFTYSNARENAAIQNKDSLSYKCINMWLAAPHRSSVLKSLNMVSKGYIYVHWKCRINLWNQKYRFMLIYWKLAESWQFKQLQNTAPQALIISSNFWMASWLCNIVLSENKNNFA